MNCLLYLVAVSILYIQVSCLPNSDVIFDDEIESWHRLKRRAGYFTESGRYKGGLYKDASTEGLSSGACFEGNRRFCTTWSETQTGRKKVRRGVCDCDEFGRRYCASWTCSRAEAECTHRNKSGRCIVETQVENVTCSCATESKNRRYCQHWTCVDNGSDDAIESASYSCRGEHSSGEYCKWWIGEISTRKEVEALVCDCREGGSKYCEEWSCKERELTICKEYGRGWCTFWLAVGVAGPLGVAFTFLGLFIASLIENRPGRIAIVTVAIIFFCFPWVIGVAIWGGTEGLIYVGIMWAAAFLLSCGCVCVKRQASK